MMEKDKPVKKYKIVFDRKKCIGAAACAAVAPDFWVMKEDGKADLFGYEKDEKGNQVLFLTTKLSPQELQNALKLNIEAAEVCPVQVIHIYDVETGEKLV